MSAEPGTSARKMELIQEITALQNEYFVCTDPLKNQKLQQRHKILVKEFDQYYDDEDQHIVDF